MVRMLTLALLLAILDMMLLGGYLYFQGNAAAQQLNLHFQQNLESSLTALGLILQNTLLGGDEIMAETIVNAMFDGSNLQSVVLKDIDNELVFQRAFAEPEAHYPSWLSVLFPAPEMTRHMEMTDGWNILGDLYVSSHINHMYNSLWASLGQVIQKLIFLTTLVWALQLVICFTFSKGSQRK